MNRRISMRCATCNQGIILRLGVGSQIKQVVAFQCPSCKLKISFTLNLDKTTKQYTPSDKFNFFECREEEDFIAINLHTELIYPKEFIHEKFMMPTAIISMRMFAHAQEKGLFNFQKALRPDKASSLPSMVSNFHGLGGDSELLEDWLVLQKAYSLFEVKKFDLMNIELSKYSRKIEELYMHNKTSRIHCVFFDFLYRFISPNLLLFNKIKINFSRAKQSKNFSAFQSFYNINMRDLYWKDYLRIFDEYFKNFSEFNRLLLNSKIELRPDEGSETYFCTSNFNDVSMFYGNAYEYLTSHLDIFACINNINHKRPYDVFEHLTLKKYTELNKDSKFNTFQGDEAFKEFSADINSTIRNASHHKWFYVDDNDTGFLLYRSGGTGAINKIAYIDYIYQSNILMIKIAIMAMNEIKFLIKF